MVKAVRYTVYAIDWHYSNKLLLEPFQAQVFVLLLFILFFYYPFIIPVGKFFDGSHQRVL